MYSSLANDLHENIAQNLLRLKEYRQEIWRQICLALISIKSCQLNTFMKSLRPFSVILPFENLAEKAKRDPTT